MKIKVDEEFMLIVDKILSFDKGDNEWALVESDDIFQTKQYEGGYDGTERAFCFSYYGRPPEEYWFQLALDDIQKVKAGELKEIEVIKSH